MIRDIIELWRDNKGWIIGYAIVILGGSALLKILYPNGVMT